MCQDPARRLSIVFGHGVLSQLAANLSSGRPRHALSGVLLGTLSHGNDNTRIEVGAFPLLKTGSLQLPGDANLETALDTELKSYPPATPRAPGCVGYFSVAAPGERTPSEYDIELFLRKFARPYQVFMFVCRSDGGGLSGELFLGENGRLVELPTIVRLDAASKRGTGGPVRLSKPLLWGAIGLVALVVAFGISRAYRDPAAVEPADETQPAMTSVFPPSRPFQLAVSRETNSLTLLWDAEAPLVRSAQTAVLVIEDGGRTAQQTLDAADLRNGKLVYVPADSNVRFRMDLVSQAGGVETASIRVLGLSSRSFPRLASQSQPDGDAIRNRLAIPSNTSASSKNSPGQISPVSDSSSVRLPEQHTPGRVKVANSPEPRVPSQPDGAAARSRVVTTANDSAPLNGSPGQVRTADDQHRSGTTEVAAKTPAPAAASPEDRKSQPATPPPNALANTKPTPAAEMQTNLIAQQTLSRPPATTPEVRTTSPVAPSEMPGRLSTSPATQEPRVKRKTNPSIPLGLQSTLRSRSRTPIVIPVRVSINANGAVTTARADGSQSGVVAAQLANIAVITAQYWSFYPATINGKPVPSEIVINFKF